MVVQPVDLSFHPPLPAKQLGLLKDMAQDVIIASSTLEGCIAAETAGALGDRLRFINSYHSNLIEGHKTTILDIEAALHKDYSRDAQRRYVQELCAAHVETERTLMQGLLSQPLDNPCNFDFVSGIHRLFYEQLPVQHQYTRNQGGFTTFSVMPGQLRDGAVSLDGGMTTHGPDARQLPRQYEAFSRLYDPAGFHGDERLIAAAGSHHRLVWLHPLDQRAARLLKALFLQGRVPRGEARSIMGMDNQSERHARRIVSQLVQEGLACSATHRAPLTIGFPAKVLRYYFPDLFGPEVLGELQ